MTAASELFWGGGDPSYWVSGTTYAIGKTVRSPTDHQRYVRVVAGAGATDPASDATNWRPDGGRPINSIQRGVITFSGSSLTASATISPVTIAKTELRFVGSNSNGNILGARLEITNTTTITATAAVSNPPAGAFIGWELTERY